MQHKKMKRSTGSDLRRLPKETVSRVRAYVREGSLIAAGDRILVAVSGGADSTSLLLLLVALRRTLDFEVEVGYFDHMLRGRRTSERELKAVQQLCDQIGVLFHSGRSDVGAHKRAKRLSTEEAARELRYGFLSKTATKQGCVSIATGHTADDHAETVLMNIIRGAGLRGLAAMAPMGPLPVLGSDTRLIRPLLLISRSETEACCRAAGIEPMQDETNMSRAFRRNRVRHEVLPLLRELNPKIDGALMRLSAVAAESDEALSALASNVVGVDRNAGGNEFRLSREALQTLPGGARKLVIRSALEGLLGTTRSISARHVDAIVRAAEKTGVKLDLARGLRVEVEREELVICIGARRVPRTPTRAALLVPGIVQFGAWRVRTALLDEPPARLQANNGVPTALLDVSALGSNAWIRPRRPGDRYQPLGTHHTRKLQDVLVDAHVPRSQRDELPLVCTERGIAWVPGQPPAEWAKVGQGTSKTLRIVAEFVEP